MSENASHSVVDAALKKYGCARESLIPVLEEIQNAFRYLPESELKYLSQKTAISLGDITGVASFYAAFRFKPAGRFSIKVCVGSACHVKGADDLYEAFKAYLKLQDGEDTDKFGNFTLSKVACLGCCMLAPAVLIENKVFGWVKPRDIPQILNSFLNSRESNERPHQIKQESARAEVRMCLCSSCAAGGAENIYKKIASAIEKNRFDVAIKKVACTGKSYRVPMLQIAMGDGMVYDYGGVSESQIDSILDAHFSPNGAIRKIKWSFGKFVNKIYAPQTCACKNESENSADNAYEKGQLRISTKYGGVLSNLDLDAYKKVGGFEAFKKACLMKPEEILKEVAISGLRGRGGGGFPTAKKWEILASKSGEKYLICNADEGDPGAFMDRMLLESFPFRVLEGMMIAAIATGATRAIIYVREEYAKAVETLYKAIDICVSSKILPFKNGFNISVFKGAGAFVCGEETALIGSLEGRRGEPKLRPPFPVERGYMGKPTLINNVETFANIAWIIQNGGAQFAKIGTQNSKGAKTFALAGKIKRGGLVEVPLGMTIRQILEEIGGGALEGRKLKAVQIGGPSGGCIPEHLFDTPVDYEALRDIGAIMGSGGLVALDDRDCMVDIAAYFLDFIVGESCGKCTACRVGCAKMLSIINKIREGKGKISDLDELEKLGNFVKSASLCGLGRTAPNPALSTLRYFREEYLAHINGKCPAGKCKKLTAYTIGKDCIGCTKCAQACASGAIEFAPLKQHKIDMDKCTRCGVCRDICPIECVEVLK